MLIQRARRRSDSNPMLPRARALPAQRVLHLARPAEQVPGAPLPPLALVALEHPPGPVARRAGGDAHPAGRFEGGQAGSRETGLGQNGAGILELRVPVEVVHPHARHGKTVEQLIELLHAPYPETGLGGAGAQEPGRRGGVVALRVDGPGFRVLLDVASAVQGRELREHARAFRLGPRHQLGGDRPAVHEERVDAAVREPEPPVPKWFGARVDPANLDPLSPGAPGASGTRLGPPSDAATYRGSCLP